MQLTPAFLSAFLLDCYEVNKKVSLDGNAAIPVLFFNTFISSLIFIPFILFSLHTDCLDGTIVYVPRVSLEDHLKVLIKAVIILSSWISRYSALKHLPLTIAGPIKVSQPALALLGAMLLFGERLNLFQWVGVLLSIVPFYLLSSSKKKGGIHFAHNGWTSFMVLSILTGAMNGLYNKHLTRSMDVMTVQVWFNVYQCVIMSFILLLLWYPNRKKSTPPQWRWNIIPISVFLCMAGWVYFYALTLLDSIISIVSMVCRSDILVTFLAGAIFFHEKNLKNKVIGLFLVLLGVILLYLGTRQEIRQ